MWRQAYQRWVLLYTLIFLVFEGCQSFFLRHTKTGKCAATSEELAYNGSNYAFPYFVVMNDNCLGGEGQFRYVHGQLLHNIKVEGTLVSNPNNYYHSRWVVYKGVAIHPKKFQNDAKHSLKQTAAGSLFFYKKSDPICAEPSSKYLLRKTYCNKSQQEFTFGSVTAYNSKTKNIHCSAVQHMNVKSADYGDFDNNGTFDTKATIDTQCSALTNCQVKSLCGGNRSCELTLNNTLLPSKYCSDTSKEIYIKYTCVDTYTSSSITTAQTIRLTQQNTGFIEINDGSIWRTAIEENWDDSRQSMLCQHLGFQETDGNNIQMRQFRSGQNIAAGDIVCYNSQQGKTSCCVHLKPSISTSNTPIPYVRCRICENELLHDDRLFPDSVFSGSGDSNNEYHDARITKGGWCPSVSSSVYLLIDLQKDYHVTEIVTLADKEQRMWSSSYSLKYSHNTSYENIVQIKGNQNGYQASITSVDLYNVRHMKIESNGDTDFCLRIEICGQAQTPAPANNIDVWPLDYSAHVTWSLPASAEDSSYITQIIVYLNNKEHKTIYRGTQVNIFCLQPYTSYSVGIQTQDGFSQRSGIVTKTFKTNEAVKCVNSESLEPSCDGKIRMDFLIPLVVLVLYFVLSLGVIIYQRRLIQNKNRQLCHQSQAPKKDNQERKYGSDKVTEGIEGVPEDLEINDDAAYEAPYSENTAEQNDAKPKPENLTMREPSIYTSLKENKEPEVVYQSLRTPQPSDIAT